MVFGGHVECKNGQDEFPVLIIRVVEDVPELRLALLSHVSLKALVLGSNLANLA
jgi:hypothetical protein